MPSKPHVLVLRAAGVNCEVETACAWDLTGALADIRHINEFVGNRALLDGYQIVTVPGGFSYGDDISAGRIFANQLDAVLGDALHELAARDGLILGICNGFQVLCKAGLLPGRSDQADLPPITITANSSQRYEDRWVLLRRCTDRCAFLRGDAAFELPVAHGEGRVLADSEEDLRRLAQFGCVALQYAARGAGPTAYPDNPNGSMLDVAGMCDPAGRVFGLMPHPERFVRATQHPAWTSRTIDKPAGRVIFESAVAYFN